jgi:hypothetical protein
MEKFKVGDLILIYCQLKAKMDIRIAQVVRINYNNSGLVGYEGVHGNNKYLPSGQGCFDPNLIGQKKFGTVKVEVIGWKRTWNQNRSYPRPGDRGYDLMC